MRSIIQLYLAFLARIVLWKHRPRIVGITGSVGKTSTREAVAEALRAKYTVRAPMGNLNNELGLPLAILGFGTPKGPIWWFLTLIAAPFRAIFSLHAPEIFVLEYGIDHPGDMDVLLAVARPHVSIVTNVESVHLEHFKDFNALATEKGKLALATQEGGVVILNYDTFATRLMAERASVRTLSFGLNAKADFSASDIVVTREGTAFTMHTPLGEKLEVRTGLLGKHVAYGLLAALATAEVLGVPGADAVRRLRTLKIPPGRMSLLPGIRGTTILDSSYNAEPASMHAAIELLRTIPARRRIAVLGDMLELGEREKDAHIELGRLVAGSVELAILIGPRMEFAYNAIRNMGPGSMRAGRMNVFHFMDRNDAIAFLVPKLKAEDLILVKASQGLRLEAVVKALLPEEQLKRDVLVRQSRAWRRRRDIHGQSVA